MTEISVIKKRKDFVKVAKQGEKVVRPTLILQAAFNLPDSVEKAQVGYTATKRLGKAHVRNRTKRRLRAVTREILPQKALSGVQYVVIGRYSTATCPFESLTTDFHIALKKIHQLLQKKSIPHEQMVQQISNPTC